MRVAMFVAGLLIAVSASVASAAGPYIGFANGVSVFHDSDVSVSGSSTTATADYDAGFAFNTFGGYNFDPVRIEGEFGYRNASMNSISSVSSGGRNSGASLALNDTDLSVLSFMANAYYDIKTGSAVTPYFGAGVGLLHGELNDSGYTSDDNVPGYQLMVGAAFKLNRLLDLDLSYRFQGAAKDFSQDGVDFSYHSSNFLAGLRFNF